MAYQKVAKKKWETPDLIAARSEAVRLHTTLKYSTGEIAKAVGKSRTQIWRWLKAARVFQPVTPKETAEKYRLVRARQRATRMKQQQEMAALKAMERLSRLYLCKECGIKFKPATGFQKFCSIACRTKYYLKSNRDVIAKKAKKKSNLFRKSRAEKLYSAKNPKCEVCQNAVPFLSFFRRRDAKYCSRKCGQKAQSENRKNDPIRAAAYKVIRTNTYLKRQLNGKNKLAKREYYRNNDQARIAKNLRSRLRLAIKEQGGKKSASTMELVGTDWLTLFVWIQSKFQFGMTWNNHGLWHIDHVIPCAAFDLTQPEQQKECFHYKNLQPLWKIENIKKGAKIFRSKELCAFDSGLEQRPLSLRAQGLPKPH
jgi:transposase